MDFYFKIAFILWAFFFLYNHSLVLAKFKTALDSRIYEKIKYALSCAFCFPFWISIPLAITLWNWQLLLIVPAMVYFLELVHLKLRDNLPTVVNNNINEIFAKNIKDTILKTIENEIRPGGLISHLPRINPDDIQIGSSKTKTPTVGDIIENKGNFIITRGKEFSSIISEGDGFIKVWSQTNPGGLATTNPDIK